MYPRKKDVNNLLNFKNVKINHIDLIILFIYIGFHKLYIYVHSLVSCV